MPTPYEKLLESCTQSGMDHGSMAFVAYDTCSHRSPVRNCCPGEALFMDVIAKSLGLPVLDSVDVSKELRDGVRGCLDTLIQSFMQQAFDEFMGIIKGSTVEQKLSRMWTNRFFLMDIMRDRVGTDVFRDPALVSLGKSWDSLFVNDLQSWGFVRFPIVFHLQWDAELTKNGKVRMLFHTTFEPWRMAVGLAMALCGPKPPIQVRETPYRDAKSVHAFQVPRKYIIDWDLYVDENLGMAVPAEKLTEAFLFDMFVRALAVIHAYMRIAGVLPRNRELCMSIKSRTRRTKNKTGRMDTKCSYHATVHVMEPAERHRVVITEVLNMVKRDMPEAYNAMVEKDCLKKGIKSPKRLKKLGDYAGFMAMDTAMTNNWHQPVQSIGSSKGDGIVFQHRALVVFRATSQPSLEIDPVRDYRVFEATDPYPNKSPINMAMLLAQHSASIPDQYSITYRPSSEWNIRPQSMGKLEKLGGKRKRSHPCLSSQAPGSNIVPDWVMDWFTKNSSESCNFQQGPGNHDLAGMPEICQIRDFKGTSVSAKGVPCIVSASLDGVITVHRSNRSYVWVASTARVDTGEELVYMKCWDPDCQLKVRSGRRAGSRVFDAFGWAHLSKENIGLLA